MTRGVEGLRVYFVPVVCTYAGLLGELDPIGPPNSHLRATFLPFLFLFTLRLCTNTALLVTSAIPPTGAPMSIPVEIKANVARKSGMLDIGMERGGGGYLPLPIVCRKRGMKGSAPTVEQEAYRKKENALRALFHRNYTPL